MEEDYDEFEAMEAEAEALAATAKQGGQKPKSNVPVTAKPGQPNPNVIPSQKPNQSPIPASQYPPKPRPAPVQQDAQPLWAAYYQPEVVGVINTQTGERMEGSKDDPSTLIAQVMARLLNDLNTIIVSGGYE